MIPFVIDNQDCRLADVLSDLLSATGGRPLDVATAYFSISGYRPSPLAGRSRYRLPRYQSTARRRPSSNITIGS